MNILFLCNGNVARSQEAELFFNNLSVDKSTHAMSAGLNVKIGKPIDPLVVEVMKESGYDMGNAERKLLIESMVDTADLIVSFKSKDELPDYVHDRDNVQFWDIPDPQQQSIEFHRKTRDQIHSKVVSLLRDLL